ncbi:DUF4300 family protein [Streptococcus pneumoniae]|uniref:DUF4300 family protein n=2 Tax=Streptococcus pneumoniae TaxID=1313 RepID=UPI001CD874B1
MKKDTFAIPETVKFYVTSEHIKDVLKSNLSTSNDIIVEKVDNIKQETDVAKPKKNSNQGVVGWVKDKGLWYYLNESGSMATGWFTVSGKWYYTYNSGDFTSFTHTEYDVEKISHLWNQKKGDFVGTNCRINSYCLLKNSVTIPKLEKNDQLLFLDNDAIDKGKVFDSQDKEEFDILFSRVPTEATTDVKVHAEKMETFFSQFQFNEKARMLSVVLHDNLDGEYLFVGHVGVLVPADDGFLFVEKLTFEEPYQAIKFASKEDCYKYLDTKYADYTGEGLAKPFIMDNDKWVKL